MISSSKLSKFLHLGSCWVVSIWMVKDLNLTYFGKTTSSYLLRSSPITQVYNTLKSSFWRGIKKSPHIKPNYNLHNKTREKTPTLHKNMNRENSLDLPICHSRLSDLLSWWKSQLAWSLPPCHSKTSFWVTRSHVWVITSPFVPTIHRFLKSYAMWHVHYIDISAKPQDTKVIWILAFHDNHR